MIMTQEDKELLLKDLCARLPYGVKCTTKSSWNGIYIIEGYKDNRVFLDCPVYDEGDDEWMIESIVPYLRPLSSMTEEEKEELIKNFWGSHTAKDTFEELSWYFSKHLDINELIPRGLAVAVTEENNPYKE